MFSCPRLLLGFAMTLLTCLCLPAANYYVDPAGNDANPGDSSARPYRFIQTAILKSQPGDTLWLMPGTHTVRPGDKNIGFKEKGGKPGQPITVTTTGPGVIIDLTDALQGWGGFRIGNDAQWIVIDGGGKPNPFDETSYQLTIQNAFYQQVANDDRSTANCRPITIQGSNHITIRNIFARRSMGSMGVFGNTKDILIENCRCVPGEKMHDPAVSHGIYVGSGADNVAIRNCFIKFGGGNRLGLQNNGGGKNVVIEDSYITACDQAIKSFNGGHVTAKNCHFWDITDQRNVVQGEVTLQNVVTTAPSEREILAAHKPTAADSSATAAIAPPPPPSPERLAAIAAIRETAETQIATRLAKTGPLELILPYKGSVQPITLIQASPAHGIAAKISGSKVTVGWADLSCAHLAGILESLLTDAEDDQVGAGYGCLAVLYQVEGNAMASAQMTTRALDLDPDLDAELKAAFSRLR